MQRASRGVSIVRCRRQALGEIAAYIGGLPPSTVHATDSCSARAHISQQPSGIAIATSHRVASPSSSAKPIRRPHLRLFSSDRHIAMDSGISYGGGSGNSTRNTSVQLTGAGNKTKMKQNTVKARKKFTLSSLISKKKKRQKITVLTAYDYQAAELASRAGVDIILVGDSLGMVVLGEKTTTGVTVEEMIHHCKAVVKGAGGVLEGPMVVGDMPFGSYLTVESAVQNAASFVKQAGVDMVKIEGGRRVRSEIKAIVDAGIPVMGHVGLTPQTLSSQSGFTVQGKTASAAAALLEDALAVQNAGASAVVLECVPAKVAEYVTSRLDIPTIGIGAGGGTSGQVLVFHDVLGMFSRFQPSFSKKYADVGAVMERAVSRYVEEVKTEVFPSRDHSFAIEDAEYQEFLQRVDSSVSGAAVKTDPSTSSASPAIQVSDACDDVVVIGGGAMGSLIGALMHKRDGTPRNVHLLSNRSEHVDAINEQAGVRVTDEMRHSSIMSVVAYKSGSELDMQRLHNRLATSSGSVLVVVAVKGEQATAEAGRHIRRLLEALPPHPAKFISILTLQNGIGHADILRRELGAKFRDSLVVGVTYMAARQEIQPGSVHMSAMGSTVVLSGLSARPESASLAATVLSKAGLSVSLQNDRIAAESHPAVWSKLIINACINPLTALLRVKNGQLATDPSQKADMSTTAIQELLRCVVAEALAVAEADGVQWPSEEEWNVNVWLHRVNNTCQNTGSNVSSMLSDVLHKHTPGTEIDNINGFISVRGKELCIDTPVNDTLTLLVKAAAGLSPRELQGSDAMESISTSPSAKIRPRDVLRSFGPTIVNARRKRTALARAVSTFNTRRRFSTRVVHTIEDMRQLRENWINKAIVSLPHDPAASATSRWPKIGFVPTMGALHSGHLKLVQAARDLGCERIVTSIFVNPTQFAPTDDLEKYPRDLEGDIKLLLPLGVDAVFAPSVREMYPLLGTSVDSEQLRGRSSTIVVPSDFEGKLAESIARPGFFTGVATVCTKLLNIVQPTHAFFGQKDAIQCLVLKRLALDLCLPTKICIVDTAREEDGLAKSSRNAYLSPEDRVAAPVVYQALSAARAKFMAGERSASVLQRVCFDVLKTEPRILNIEYVDVACSDTGRPLCDPLRSTSAPVLATSTEQHQGSCLLSVAVKLKSVRLIDNIILA